MYSTHKQNVADYKKFKAFMETLTQEELGNCRPKKFWNSKEVNGEYVVCPVCPVANAAIKGGFSNVKALNNDGNFLYGKHTFTSYAIGEWLGINQNIIRYFTSNFDDASETIGLDKTKTSEQITLEAYAEAMKNVQKRLGLTDEEVA